VLLDAYYSTQLLSCQGFFYNYPKFVEILFLLTLYIKYHTLYLALSVLLYNAG